ncbi:glycosyltransferase family 2 protein [Roseofilum sp. BLCC_M154]|uniref:Glycosyltransferase family 2 protein n=1 Tax=Roseofilum acuticapitatum BLCC-M154 TaxID=3022444 RepID=A0ABT7AN22_9CYAN|nr:glycosyltransferase family 2 protein [Roseofilum acuticapitatum]MDJ1168297.1 glycosyltransferase family 2 protein [Roseofilum acuticapitatum BLCC-M154]
MLTWGLMVMQIPAIAILLFRLVKGPFRHAPIEPQSADPQMLGSVSVVVPTLNERDRLSPCLEGLTRQSYEVREVLVVDSHSTDGTGDLVLQTASKDPRFRLIYDDPLPGDWVGRPWALHTGFLHSSPKSEWILGIDADTVPHPGLVAGLIKIAQEEGYDLVSLSPRFILEYPGECWLQPALLMTLVYRFGPTGTFESADRIMANGQCFLIRRRVLEELEGYTTAKSSFCDDVTLARIAAQRGFKVAFWDGAPVLKVRMYEGAWQTWQEWGRSLDLKDATSPGQLWTDLWFLFAVQGLPLAVVILGIMGAFPEGIVAQILVNLNWAVLAIRFALGLAIFPSYDLSTARFSFLFWLSPLADPLGFLRILFSSFQTSIQWRGRIYGKG